MMVASQMIASCISSVPSTSQSARRDMAKGDTLPGANPNQVPFRITVVTKNVVNFPDFGRYRVGTATSIVFPASLASDPRIRGFQTLPRVTENVVGAPPASEGNSVHPILCSAHIE